jgi:hypothetical protein
MRRRRAQCSSTAFFARCVDLSNASHSSAGDDDEDEDEDEDDKDKAGAE